jgi:hypothetical protein
VSERSSKCGLFDREKTARRCPCWGLAARGMSGGYGPAHDAESIATIARVAGNDCLNAGVRRHGHRVGESGGNQQRRCDQEQDRSCTNADPEGDPLLRNRLVRS